MMSRTAACIIARTVSTRLPLKVLRDVGNGQSMLDFLIGRLKTVPEIDTIYLCTSKEPVDDILEDVAFRNQVNIYRGSADQVIERMLAVGRIENADILLRITGDNPFTSVEYIPAQIQYLKEKSLDYVRLVRVPIGATAEVMRSEALKRCNERMDPSVSEYLLLYMFDPEHFKCGVMQVLEGEYSLYSLTVDTPDDLIRTREIIRNLDSGYLLKDIIRYYQNHEDSLPAVRIPAEGSIKLPYDKQISFSEFEQDIDRRINLSEKVLLYA